MSGADREMTKIAAGTFEALLTADQAVAFRADGHTLVRGILSGDEAARNRAAIRDAAMRFNSENRPLAERDTYGKAFLQVMNLWRRDEQVRQFVLDERLARIAARLLGVDRVRLYHDQALIKEPGGGKTPWHQDQYYWPLDTDRTVTMWMPLVDIDEEMGMLTFASGSHWSGPASSLEISDASEEFYEAYVRDHGFPVVRADRMKAGDATFHLGWTIHSAGPNRSAAKDREVMTVIYYADGATVTEPVNPHQAADLEAWLGGRRPGELADSELNPVINR